MSKLQDKTILASMSVGAILLLMGGTYLLVSNWSNEDWFIPVFQALLGLVLYHWISTILWRFKKNNELLEEIRDELKKRPPRD